MEVLPIDVTGLVAILMSSLVVLIPIAGLTARFALKPLVESLSHYLQAQGGDEAMRIAERRIALLEQTVDALEHEVGRVRDAQNFDTALRAGGASAELPATTPDGTASAGGDASPGTPRE